MIDRYRANKYCREDISLIENYDKAVNDTTQTWQIHHKDEIRTLPSGMVVYRSQKDLIEGGRYYNCPANELIFLTKSEHCKLHLKYRPKLSEDVYRKAVRNRIESGHQWHSEATKRKISASRKGKSSWNKGKHYTCEAISKALFGKHLSDNTKRNMSLSRTGRKWYNDGINEYFIYPNESLDNYSLGRLKKVEHLANALEKQNEIMLAMRKKDV